MGKKKAVTLGLESVEPKIKTKEKKEKETKIKTKKTSKKKRELKKKHGRKYLAATRKFTLNKEYLFPEAIKILKQITYEKFEASIEVNLNVDKSPLKGEVELPYAAGKPKKIVIYSSEVKKNIEKNELDFDILIATPKDMPEIIKHAKLLGPKGLMPSTKKNTIVDEPEKAVAKYKDNLIHYRTEPKFPIIHQTIGKTKLSEKELLANLTAFINAVGQKHIKSGIIKSSMSPAIKLKFADI